MDNTIEVEAYQALLARAHRKTGAVPPELVVRHILAVWPVRREALEALLRRVAFGKADGLRIVSRPGGGRLLGVYATRRKGSPARPYRTLLRRLDPIVGHCDCADFCRPVERAPTVATQGWAGGAPPESLAKSKHCRCCWPNGQRIGRRNGNGRFNGTGGHSTVRAGNGTGPEIPTRQNRQNPPRRVSSVTRPTSWALTG